MLVIGKKFPKVQVVVHDFLQLLTVASLTWTQVVTMDTSQDNQGRLGLFVNR